MICSECQKPIQEHAYTANGSVIGCDNCITEKYSDEVPIGTECPLCGYTVSDDDEYAYTMYFQNGECCGCELCNHYPIEKISEVMDYEYT